MQTWAAILAAGRGERMRIATPKPLIPLLGRPMIEYPLEALRKAGVASPIIITSAAGRAALKGHLGSATRFILQPQPLGTGDAVNRLKQLARGSGRLVIINADSPLFGPDHIRALLAAHSAARAQVSFATATVTDPSGLGRVLRDPTGQVTNIVEEAEASPAVRSIREINAGLYVFEVPAIFDLLSEVKPVGKKRERYLTRAVELAIARGFSVTTVSVPPEASFGVNTLAEAAQAQAVLLSRKLAALMASGVSLDDPAGVSVEWNVTAGPGTRILGGTIITGATRIGANCTIGPHTVIDSSTLGDRVTVRSSWVTGSRLEHDVEIGPYAHVRPGCVLKRRSHIGTHAEIVRTTFGEDSRMHHFSYLGDAEVGPFVNIGAGAISANYDGKLKHRTRIARGAFIGSGAVLIAPASIGANAVIGAGAVVPAGRKVAAGATVAGVPARPLKKKR